MKTSFNIAWVDDNYGDPEMKLPSQLRRKISRKNGFSLTTEDVYAEVESGRFDNLLSSLASTIDLSNSFDLILIDYELGSDIKGEKFARKFRASLPSVDILFYSGKHDAEDLRRIIASENVDGVNCVGRNNLSEGTYSVIENIINRSYKISTLRGLILNSVCEMDHMIREALYKYGANDTANEAAIRSEAIRLFRPRRPAERTAFENMALEDLLNDKLMMSGRLFGVLESIKRNLQLSNKQIEILNLYRSEILDLRATAAHAKEATCQATGQSMLTFKKVEYKRGDIDDICKTIVKHECNIQSVFDVIT